MAAAPWSCQNPRCPVARREATKSEPPRHRGRDWLRHDLLSHTWLRRRRVLSSVWPRRFGCKEASLFGGLRSVEQRCYLAAPVKIMCKSRHARECTAKKSELLRKECGNRYGRKRCSGTPLHARASGGYSLAFAQRNRRRIFRNRWRVDGRDTRTRRLSYSLRRRVLSGQCTTRSPDFRLRGKRLSIFNCPGCWQI